jgi:hypothetical protein
LESKNSKVLELAKSCWFSAKTLALRFPLPAENRKTPFNQGLYRTCNLGVAKVPYEKKLIAHRKNNKNIEICFCMINF